MYRNFKEIEKKARKLGPKPVAVLFPDTSDVMAAVFEGADHDLIEPILIGDQAKIEAAAECNHDNSWTTFHDKSWGLNKKIN